LFFYPEALRLGEKGEWIRDKQDDQDFQDRVKVGTNMGFEGAEGFFHNRETEITEKREQRGFTLS